MTLTMSCDVLEEVDPGIGPTSPVYVGGGSRDNLFSF